VAHKLSRVNFDIAVEDGDVLTVGKVSLKIIYTPGHSVDSICILVDNKRLITGDTLFVGECDEPIYWAATPKICMIACQ